VSVCSPVKVFAGRLEVVERRLRFDKLQVRFQFHGVEHMDDVKGAERCGINRRYRCRHFGTYPSSSHACADDRATPGIAEVRNIAEAITQEGQI
jgi:hypothetical protein